MCAYWLFKSEPSVFSIEDLKAASNQTTHWNGVRNYQARNFIRDEMKNGDLVFFYHSNTDPNAIVGLCKIVREAYPDGSAMDQSSEYYDPKSSPDNPIWYMVDIQYRETFANPLLLGDLKELPGLENFRLLQRGNRLSVFPVSESEAEVLLEQAKKSH